MTRTWRRSIVGGLVGLASGYVAALLLTGFDARRAFENVGVISSGAAGRCPARSDRGTTKTTLSIDRTGVR